MDVALLLLLPVIGGYYLAAKWNFSRFRCAREDGHRLYFRAALYGSVVFILVYVLRLAAAKFISAYGAFETFIGLEINPLLKFDKDSPSLNLPIVAITAVYTLAFGLLLPKLLNRYFSETKYLWQAVQDNDFERLIYTSVEKQSSLALTIENHKVYVGYVSKTMDPTQQRKTLGLIPVMSGYRHDDGKIEFTTYYEDIYAEIERGEDGHLAHLSREDFEVVLPIDKILSANMFDIIAYEEFGRI